MCDICRKYCCPDGCPNNYIPKGKRKVDEGADIRRQFAVRAVVYADGESFKNIIINKK